MTMIPVAAASDGSEPASDRSALGKCVELENEGTSRERKAKGDEHIPSVEQSVPIPLTANGTECE